MTIRKLIKPLVKLAPPTQTAQSLSEEISLLDPNETWSQQALFLYNCSWLLVKEHGPSGFSKNKMLFFLFLCKAIFGNWFFILVNDRGNTFRMKV